MTWLLLLRRTRRWCSGRRARPRPLRLAPRILDLPHSCRGYASVLPLGQLFCAAYFCCAGQDGGALGGGRGTDIHCFWHPLHTLVHSCKNCHAQWAAWASMQCQYGISPRNMLYRCTMYCLQPAPLFLCAAVPLDWCIDVTHAMDLCLYALTHAFMHVKVLRFAGLCMLQVSCMVCDGFVSHVAMLAGSEPRCPSPTELRCPSPSHLGHAC